MEADAVFLSDGLSKLTGEDMPSPVYDLPTLVRAKAVPRKPTQVGASINHFLRRDIRPRTAEINSDIPAEGAREADNPMLQGNGIVSGRQLADDTGHSPAPSSSSLELSEEASVLEKPPLTSSPDIPIGEHQPDNPLNPIDMEEGTDYFSLLGLTPAADDDEIKKAYRRLMIQVGSNEDLRQVCH